MTAKKRDCILCVGSMAIAVFLFVLHKYIETSILAPAGTVQEWLDLSQWRAISHGITIVALILLLANMVYFMIRKKNKWLAAAQLILFVYLAFLA